MRAAGVIFRTPVTVETPGENYGDGPTYAEPRTVLAQVQQERVTSYDDTGQVRTKPMVLLLPHDDDVPVGARITVDGVTATVMKSKPVRGAYGVIHHREVTAQ